MATPLDPNFSPYKGLQPYTENDRAYFFGRERDQEIITANLYAAPLTVLYGASGVGKSSVLMAGVAPQLRSTPGLALAVYREWQDAGFLHALKKEVLRAVSASAGKQIEVDINQPFDDFLFKCKQAFGGSIFFILDQFEEYFLYHPLSASANGSSQKENFDATLARAINREDIDANFLLSMRDDGLSKLDRFQGRIPNLLNNMLRLEHLDLEAAESAVRRPLQEYNKKAGASGSMNIEDALVEVLLKDVRTGKVTLNQTGQGKVSEPTHDDLSTARIETPFLQMVLMRLWDEERKAGSQLLHLHTYARLGKAENIVRTHLDDVMEMEKLKAHRDTAASIFHFLVTPTGQKIAHTPGDLFSYTEKPQDEVTSVLELLILPDVRILRPIAPPPEQPSMLRYEIFHDVLAPAILDWRTRFVESKRRVEANNKLIEAERLAAGERARAARFRWLTIALAFVSLFAVGSAVYALTQQAAASENRRIAEANKKSAEENRKIAERNRILADSSREDAKGEHSRAEAEATRAEQAKQDALVAQNAASVEHQRAEAALKQAAGERQRAEAERVRAESQAQRAATEQTAKQNEQAIRKYTVTAGKDRRSGLKKEAIAEYMAALNLFPPNDAHGRANVHLEIGDTYQEIYSDEKEKSNSTNDDKEEGNTQKEGESNQPKTNAPLELARHNYEQAFKLFEQHGASTGDYSDAAGTLSTLGEMIEENSPIEGEDDETEKNRKAVALNYYDRAFGFYKRMSDVPKMIVTLEKLGELAELIDDKAKALSYYEQLPSLYQQNVGNDKETATKTAAAYENMGGLQAEANLKQKALVSYGHALDIYRSSDNAYSQTSVLLALGWIYRDLGERQQALEFYLQSLPLMDRRVSDPLLRRQMIAVTRRRKSISLTAIGDLYDELNNREKALEFYQQARASILQGYGKKTDDASAPQSISPTLRESYVREDAPVLVRMGKTYLELGDKQQAFKAYARAFTHLENLTDAEDKPYPAETEARAALVKLCEASSEIAESSEICRRAKQPKPKKEKKVEESATPANKSDK